MVKTFVRLLSWCSLVVAMPLASQTVALEQVGALPGPADLVRVSGDYAYVGAGRTLSVVDIRDLATPRVRGSVTLSEPIYSLTLSGTNGYVANGLRGLAVLDLSNPDAPRSIGSHQTPGEALRVALTGTRALVVNRMSGMEAIDVSDPARPVSLGSYYTEGYARDVAAAGSLAYVVDSSADFAVVDLSKPGEPKGLSTQLSSTPTAFVAVERPGVPGQDPKIVYVVGGGVLQVYDVANPSTPRKMTTVKISDRTQAVVVEGAVAYLAAGAEGLQIIDLSNPAVPIVAGSYRTPSAARDVAVAGPLVFVTVASPPGVLVFRKRP